MNKKILLTVVTVATSGLVLFGATSIVKAETTNSNRDNIIDKLVSKFKLNKADVQAVFDQARTDRQKQRLQMMTDRLSQAVKDGKITEAQKTAILQKFQERQTERQKERQEMQDWANKNGIDFSKIGGMGRGMHGWHM